MSNTFRSADAFEFVDAVRACNMNKDVALSKINELSERLKRIENSGREVPSYLLAAYRGYEFVLTGPAGWDVVKLREDEE